MDIESFRALVVEENEDKSFSYSLQQKNIQDLPEGEVLIRVQYSSLNYKDALSASGNRGVTRNYPHTPGIDGAGRVVQSKSEKFKAGDEVLVTGYDLGMNTSGGFGEYISVPESWVVPLPAGLSLKEAMILGTAGFTAGMCVAAIVEKVTPEKGPILVTGATGGVGSLAVAILNRLGYKVVAVSGKSDAAGFLLELGADKIINREEAGEGHDRPMLKTLWAGVVDTVGGEILAAAIKATDLLGVVTCCGNVASPELNINVFPFILRGVSLVGIDSQNCPMIPRLGVWQKLSTSWKPEKLGKICREVTLETLDDEIKLILQGGQKGRVVVKMT